LDAVEISSLRHVRSVSKTTFFCTPRHLKQETCPSDVRCSVKVLEFLDENEGRNWHNVPRHQRVSSPEA